MVALHNRRLTARDIFPDNLWSMSQWNEKLDEYEKECAAEGLKHPEAFFEARKRLAQYQRDHDGGAMRGQQAVMKRIYPRLPAKPSNQLTEDELKYLIDRLYGVNDPDGQAIRTKLETILDTLT